MLVELAQRHLRSRPLELEVKKMAPDAAGTTRKIPEDARIEAGWALARPGDGGWWPAIERGLRAGRLDDEIAVALANALRAAETRPAWVTSVPSARLGDVCAELGERLAAELARALCGGAAPARRPRWLLPLRKSRLLTSHMEASKVVFAGAQAPEE